MEKTRNLGVALMWESDFCRENLGFQSTGFDCEKCTGTLITYCSNTF